MQALVHYLNSLSVTDQRAFAERCRTSLGYLRKACSAGGRLGEDLCIRLAVESGNAVTCEALRPDVDWEQYRRWPELTTTHQSTEQGAHHA